MANTYTLISSQVLGSNTASITFSSIPGTYTDLTLRVSARSDDAGQMDYLQTRFNSDSATNYSNTWLRGNGSVAASGRTTSSSYIQFLYSTNASGSVANTYGNSEIYIPSYTASQNKPIFHFGVKEENATQTFMGAQAGLWRNTDAITSITITPVFGTTWLATSSFYLYGIKNS